MTRPSSVLAILACGVLCGCVQYEHPLSPLTEAKYDEQIFGSWHLHHVNADGKPETLFLHIGPAGKLEDSDSLDRNYFLLGSPQENEEFKLPQMTRVVIVSIQPDREVSQLSFLVFPSTVEGKHYMNAPLIRAGKIYSYGIVKYQLEGDKLTVWGEANDEAMKKLVKEGKIHESEKGNVIGENAEALRKLFVENDTLLFPPNDNGTFQRIGSK